MAQVFISIGSNIDREASIRGGVAALQQRFGALQLSSVYESEAVGFDGDHFLNLVAGFETGEPVTDVAAALRAIEDQFGRDRSGPKFSSRTLDLDMLVYDELVLDEPQIPRDEIVKNAFVLQPLAEIAPDSLHPQLQLSYAELWQQFDKSKQPLWPIPFEFPG